MEKGRVVIAMSGGVDSSVAAALLKQQGYDVIGMMMRLWSEPGTESENRCCTPDAMAQARRVAAILGIPFYAVDARQVFHETVVQQFISGYAQGLTPNPCLTCNRQIRWQFLFDHARTLGADFMATGHYARLQSTPEGVISLRKALDSHKDQSYILHVLTQDKLQHALFPLGEYTKPQVRALARQFKLPVSERPDSQDLCFLGNGDYRAFLQRNAPETAHPGPILSQSGAHLGEHSGLAFYTIGQRKGLGLSSPVPMYVLAKDLQRNVLIVGAQAELGQSELVAGPVSWVAGRALTEPFRAQARIRYKAQLAWAAVTPLDEGKRFHLRFDLPLRDITPGQAAVLYDGDNCLGGGVIQP